MKAYQAPLDDIFYCVNTVANASQLPTWDPELASEVVRVYAKFIEQEVAPLNEIGDREGCRFEDGRVKMPFGFKEVYRRYSADGWQGLGLPEEFGGQGMGGVLQSICSEIFSGANHSLQMVLGLTPGATRVLLEFGTPQQQQTLIPLLASGEYLATMCLTEPGAGSDLARIRCKATEQDDSWIIDGEKIFISGGDQDLSDGILHLVLARTGGDGVRGLSLFACQSRLADGSRNSVSVQRIEEKMGLHASPTCQLQFGGAQAELIGEAGEGLRAMFAMMNHARIDVSLQGVAHAARACDIACTYTAERLQGKDHSGEQVTIDQHEDVRQMLDEMMALCIGARAIAFNVLVMIESGKNPALVNFLTPVAKVFCTEAGIQAASLGQQVLGGYGYLNEYLVEQVYRDARITSIYEGTNGIHAKSLLMRELRTGGASEFEKLIGQLAEESGNRDVESCLGLWHRVKESQLAKQTPPGAARDFMELTSRLLYLALWARIFQSAGQAPDPEMYRRVGKRVLKYEPLEIEMIANRLLVGVP